MKFCYLVASVVMGANLIQSATSESAMLFDFTTAENVNQWSESSDVVRKVGKSKGTLTLQKTQIFQRGIFFSLLKPQPNGAAFAGVAMPTKWNLSDYRNIEIKCRGQGANDHYKIVLRHKGQSANEVGYEQFFTVPLGSEEMSTIVLPLSEFQPYYRGRPVPDNGPLDTEHITSFGLQIYGGVYSPLKQKGVSALELETITATK